jgi:hypothetical protein
MADDYDAKFHDEGLLRTTNHLLQRMMRIESAFDSLYHAVSAIALATGTFNGKVEEKLKEAAQHRDNAVQ